MHKLSKNHLNRGRLEWVDRLGFNVASMKAKELLQERDNYFSQALKYEAEEKKAEAKFLIA